MSRRFPDEDDEPGFDGPSRSALKRESEALQDLGVALLDLRESVFAALDLPDALRDAVAEARRITARGGLRRQRQYIGKLMRRQDEATIAAISRALDAQHKQSAREKQALHQAETWRERLLAEDAALGEWLSAHPGSDIQQFRALIRQARKDAEPAIPGGEPRHGRAYRALFKLIREQLLRSAR